MTAIIRSLLFVPGSRPERFEKALAAGADMICIDLEDAVLPADKGSARNAVANFLKQIKHTHSEAFAKVCIRTNPVDTQEGAADFDALAFASPAYIMLAKCASSTQVKQAAQRFNKDSATAPTRFIGLIESIQGLDNAREIATASEHLIALMFGGADMSAELRCEFSYEPLLYARQKLVVAAACANVELIDVPYVDIHDVTGLEQETKRIKALGFSGKAAIHPKQIIAIHASFTPSQAQIDYANAVISAVDGLDSGVAVVNGRMVDRPIILACQRTLLLAAQD